MILLPTLLFFILGLIVGSFLNVVIIRYNTHRTFGGRSACMSCQNTLSWYELIPVFSFLGLKGRCRNCKHRISIAYPIVETITGVIFAGLFLKLQNIFVVETLSFAFTYAYYASMFSLLIVISAYDLRHKIIPDLMVVFLGVLSFIGLFLFTDFGFYPHIPSLMDFLSGFFIAIPFAAIWFFSRGAWMGLGDAKLVLGLGWFLGLSQLLSGVVIA